jgi:hypothetical protein
MPIERPEAEAISIKNSLKQLGIWLRQNKQQNIKSIEMSGNPVAAQAGLLALLATFAVQYVSGAVFGGEGVGGSLQAQITASIKEVFGGVTDFIKDKIGDLTDLVAAGNPAETAASTFVKAEVPLKIIDPTGDFNTAASFYPSVIGSSEPLKQAMLNTQAYIEDLYTGSGLEKVYNIVQTQLKDADTYLAKKGIEGLAETVSLENTVKTLADKTLLTELQTKYDNLTTLTSVPGNNPAAVQAALDDYNSQMTKVQSAITADQTAQRTAEANNALIQEMGGVHDMLQRFQDDKAAATAAGDTDTYNDIVAFETIYRSTIDPKLLPVVDQIIVVNKTIGEAKVAVLTTPTVPVVTSSPVIDQDKQNLGTLV